MRSGVIVLGPFRSGTSLVSGILEALGADFGPPDQLYPRPDRYNPGGYYQRPDVVRANSRLIRIAGGSLCNPPSVEKRVTPDDKKALGTVDVAWAEGLERWAVKDPRFCATLGVWIAAELLNEEQLRIVRVRRRIESTALSVIRHHEVSTFCGGDLQAARVMSARYDELAERQIRVLKIPTLEVFYESFLAEPAQTVRTLVEFLEVDSGKVHRGVRVIGKRKALVRHYINKIRHLNLLGETLAKTARRTAGRWS